MTSQYRHRRTASPDVPFANPLEPGEIAVNTANRQIAVGDALSGSVGTPLPLLAVRVFDARSKYAINDLIAYNGSVLVALVAITPGAFNPTQWKNITADTDLTPYLPKAGGVMTGPITLAANAAAALQAVPLQQLTSSIAAIPPPPPPLYISDTAPVGAPDNSMWWNSNSGILYVRFHDVDSTAWVQAVALPGGDLSGLVKKAGDTMSGPLSLAGNATTALHAVPKQQLDTVAATAVNALAYSGMQINGSFEVSQELGSTGRNSIGYICDGWQVRMSGMTGIGAAVDNLVPIPGFPWRIYVSVTPKPSLLATDFFGISHIIEGYRASRLGWGTASAQPITVGFWSAHNVAGVFSVTARNFDSTRSYCTTYTQNVANTPEYKTVTIPGDTSGVWKTDNLSGINIYFGAASGTDWLATANNTWLVGNYTAAQGQVNGTASTFVLRGVVILPGIEAPSAARSALIMRPYDQELLTCKRYYQKSFSDFIPVGVNKSDEASALALQSNGAALNSDGVNIRFPIDLRSSPSMLFYNPVVADNTWRDQSSGLNFPSNVVGLAGPKGVLVYVSGATTAGHTFLIHWSADARL